MIKELLKLDNLKANYSFGSLEFHYTGKSNEIPFYYNDINFILDKYDFINRSVRHRLDDQSEHYSYDSGNDRYVEESHELDFNYIQEIILEIKSNDKIKMIIFRFIIKMNQSEEILNKYVTDQYNSNKPN